MVFYLYVVDLVRFSVVILVFSFSCVVGFSLFFIKRNVREYGVFI